MHLPLVHDTFLQNNGFSSSLPPQSFSPSQRYRLSRQTLLFGHFVCPVTQFLTADNNNNSYYKGYEVVVGCGDNYDNGHNQGVLTNATSLENLILVYAQK